MQTCDMLHSHIVSGAVLAIGIQANRMESIFGQSVFVRLSPNLSQVVTCYDHRKSAGAYPLRLSQQLLKWACVKAAVPKKKPFNHSWLDPIEATSCFTRCWAYPGGTRDLHRSIGSFPMRSCQCCHTFWGR